MNSKLVISKCGCKRRKKFRLIFDGGSTGNYAIEICQKCRNKEDNNFLLKDENIWSVDAFIARMWYIGYQ